MSERRSSNLVLAISADLGAALLGVLAKEAARRTMVVAVGRAAYWAGRTVGAVAQVREAVAVATLPLEVPRYPWPKALRAAWGVLRGRDARPFLRVRNLAANVAREAFEAREEQLRKHFENVRAARGVN